MHRGGTENILLSSDLPGGGKKMQSSGLDGSRLWSALKGTGEASAGDNL